MVARHPQGSRFAAGGRANRPDLRLLWRAVVSAEDRAFLAAAGLYVFFGTLDCLTTARALALGAHERNPIARTLYTHYGVPGLYLFKALIVAVILFGLATLPRRIGVWVTTVFAAGVGVAVMANVHVLIRH